MSIFEGLLPALAGAGWDGLTYIFGRPEDLGFQKILAVVNADGVVTETEQRQIGAAGAVCAWEAGQLAEWIMSFPLAQPYAGTVAELTYSIQQFGFKLSGYAGANLILPPWAVIAEPE